MEITYVNVTCVDKEDSKMKGKAVIVLDEAIKIHDIRIIENNDSLFVAMPSRKLPSGEYKDSVHPVSQEIRDKITKVILDEYEKVKAAEE